MGRDKTRIHLQKGVELTDHVFRLVPYLIHFDKMELVQPEILQIPRDLFVHQAVFNVFRIPADGLADAEGLRMMEVPDMMIV